MSVILTTNTASMCPTTNKTTTTTKLCQTTSTRQISTEMAVVAVTGAAATWARDVSCAEPGMFHFFVFFFNTLLTFTYI